jgi:hypothetical protein
MYRRRGYYYPHFYPYYHPSGKGFLAVSGDDSKSEAVKAIASIIVDNREELIKELDDLKIACSCGLVGATEADLSDIIVENLGNEKLRKWIAERTASKFAKSSNADGGADPVSAIANALGQLFKATGTIVGGAQHNKAVKGEYKNLIATEALKYKAEQEKAKRTERTTNTLLIAGASLAFLGLGAVFYFGSTKQAPVLVTA